MGFVFSPVGRDVEDGRGRGAADEGAVVANVGPQPCLPGSAACQERHRGVVSVEPLGRQDMGLDEGMDRLQHHGADPDLVGEGREAEVDALSGIALGLPVQRLVLPKLLEEDGRQEVGSGPSPRRGVERRRRLTDPLAVSAGELLRDCQEFRVRACG